MNSIGSIRIKSTFWLLSLALTTMTLPLSALTGTITSVSQTQAVLEEQGFSGACSIQLSTSPNFTPLHPDMDPGKYSQANTDTMRADTLTVSNGAVRLVTLGHMNDDRALAANTAYYYQISGCGGTFTASFVTATLSDGTTRSEQSPFNASKWANLGLPTFDWTTKRSYVDPLTGATLVPMATSIQTWRSGCHAGGCIPGATAFADWSGGAGWTNASTILAGATTTATTTNKNPIDLYADLSIWPLPFPYDWHRVLEDVGVVVWGGGNSPAAADRVIDICIFLNPAAGCASNTIQVTLPENTVAHVASGSSDLDGAFPAAFPSSPFFGWTQSVSPLIHMENQETFGTLSTSGNTLSIANINSTQHFSSAMVAGQKIFVAGSACANSLCTVAAPPSGPGAVTVVEQPGVSSAAFRAYGWGVRVWKDTANGSVTAGLNFKLAGSDTPVGIQSLGDKCSTVQVTSGDGKTGYLCSLTSMVTGFGWLAFIANDGTTRILSCRTGFSFDDVKGNVFYAGGVNSSGGWTVYQYTYTGDYTKELNYNYTCSSAGDCPSFNDLIPAPVDLMPHASGADLDQQIEAGQGKTLPAYNSSIYGPWTQQTSSVQYFGSSGHFAFFCNIYSGQGQPASGGPGWCAAVDLSQSPAKVVRLIHTLDGTGAPNARFGSLHNAQGVDSRPNTLFLSLDILSSNSTSTLHGGPFQAGVIGVLEADGVTWNTNTSLPWPPDSSYYRPCPKGTITYIECVTFRLPQGGVCNVGATSLENTNWPCPWNSGYSQYPLMQPGDNSVDMNGVGGVDSEHFRILSTTPDTGGTLRVVAARNGVYDYCSISPWHGAVNQLSAQSANQLQHANGWVLTMMPGSFDSCGGASLVQDQVSGTVEELGRGVQGHFAIGVGASGYLKPLAQTQPGAGGMNYVTSAATIYNTPFSLLGRVPPLYNTASPAFHGSPAQIGSQLQSYTDDSQTNAGPVGTSWALDMNPLVPCGAEALGCGTIRTTIPIAGNVYKIEAIGSSPQTNATYKTQPMIGWAGRYQLQDASGPSANIDNIPYSMCFVINPGECHAGSAANEIYINVPVAYDPGYCSGGLSWVNDPCVLFGDNAPAGGIRQFSIAANDPTGSYSRFVSNGWSSIGRHYPYSHAIVHPSGQWVMVMGTNSMDGYSMTGFTISLPPLPVPGQHTLEIEHDNDFRETAIKLPSGYSYAEIQFGYSRYIGAQLAPARGLYCTARADGCNTSASASSMFNFESEPRTLKNCGGGCTINIPEIGPNVIYYRTRQSNDGVTWVNSDLTAIAIP